MGANRAVCIYSNGTLDDAPTGTHVRVDRYIHCCWLWNSPRLSRSTHGKVTKAVNKTALGVGGVKYHSSINILCSFDQEFPLKNRTPKP